MAIKFEQPTKAPGTTGAPAVQPPASGAPVAASVPPETAQAPVSVDSAPSVTITEKRDLYYSNIPIWNPDQKTYLHNLPQAIVVDRYWQMQITAGIVKKC